MKNFDKTLGIILAIVSILSCVANYFNVLTTLLLVTDFIVGIFATALSMMETYQHQPYFNRNSGWFWFLYSVSFAIILVGIFYATGLELLSEDLGLSLMMGLSPTILPTLGIFFGDIGRILFKGEPSVI